MPVSGRQKVPRRYRYCRVPDLVEKILNAKTEVGIVRMTAHSQFLISHIVPKVHPLAGTIPVQCTHKFYKLFEALAHNKNLRLGIQDLYSFLRLCVLFGHPRRILRNGPKGRAPE